MRKLEGKTAIVTGAGRGLGRAIALSFARDGAEVVLAARTVSEIAAVAGEVKQLGGAALAVPTDVSKKLDVDAMVKQAISRFGKIDILVNNAGIPGTSPIPKITEELWDRNIAVNLKAVFLCTQAVFSHMCDRGSGHIINISSLAGRHGGPKFGAYSASKFGVTGFTEVTAAEGRPHGVKATLIEPGPADTKLRRDFHKDDLSKLARPEDVADLVMLVVTQSPKVYTPVLSLYATENPQIEMIEHWKQE